MSNISIIGGCGRAGLPLGLLFAKAGHDVHLIDVDKTRVAEVAAGRMPFKEENGQELLTEVKSRITATDNHQFIRHGDVVVFIVGTPLDEHLDPNVRLFDRVIKSCSGHFQPGQLLIVRSTVYPGTTERLAATYPNQRVAYCPERVVEGLALTESVSIPQIVAGVNTRSHDLAKKLFSTINNTIVDASPREAELAKLFTNSWRYISFAVSNQFYMLSSQFGVDFHRVRSAMMENYPRMDKFPKPGFTAGPCLFKDTMQLASASRDNFMLGRASVLVNEGLPKFIVEEIKTRYEDLLRKMTVGIAGMAFKAESDDPRESLSYKLKKNLELECERVLCSDPFVKDSSLVPLDTLLKECHLVVIGAPHSCYDDLRDRINVFDVWNGRQPL